ncbi:hypothetical protein EMIT07CA2_60261 [Brevibacillus sp. IT-7CA2]|uniref:hypothetical protein n=1 Tax=Brevibacillus sp. IT-7CA2 TaxID=3026436 RepID=UPI0039E10E9A
MSRIIKRKYKQARKEFKQDLYVAAKENHAHAMLMLQNYVASHHRTHIMEIWELLGIRHEVAYKDYCNTLMGKLLSGTVEVTALCGLFKYEAQL